MGSLKQVPSTCIDSISFRVYTEEEIEKISAVLITREESFNYLGHHVEKGVYDLFMGPMNARENEICKTCGMEYFSCSGHCGHINLPLPVCNPFFYTVLKEVLERICRTCFRYQAPEKKAIEFCYECKFLFAGYDQMALDVHSMVSQISSNPSEALESYLDADESENSENVSLGEIGRVASSLHKIFVKTKKTKEPFKSPTCNTESVYTSLRKRFVVHTRTVKPICLFCKARLLKIKYQNSKLQITNAEDIRTDVEEGLLKQLVSDSQPYLTAEQARTMLRKCFAQDGEILKCLYPILGDVSIDKNKYSDAQPTDIFFLKKLLVIPPKHRPCNKINDRLIEHEVSVLYKTIVMQSKCLKYLIHVQKNGEEAELSEALLFMIKQLGNTSDEKIFKLWSQLQCSVDNILDAELNPLNRIANRGVRQLFEKKFGIIRRHLMGKRSDHCGRSVAAPDPWLAVDQVGVPIEFAKKLTYPVPVTPWNVCQLRKLVQNGPDNFPGAVSVEDEQGRKVTLKEEDYKQRNAIAQSLLTPLESCVKKVNETKIVYRHLQNGDYVLINRQPTLHKPSIQAHKARVMPKDRVIRLPYASCKAYNADFDGDELNLHFPQNELARSESHHIITTRNQYLTPKDGTPLSGLIQDCIVASVKLTMRGKFFNAEDYQQLIFVSLSHLPGKIRLLPPAILKPQKLWSGKQVISTLLVNLIPDDRSKPTFNFKTTVKDDMWQTQPKRLWRCGGPPDNVKLFMTESEFIMREGELVSGIVDKCAIGSTSYGLVHVCYDLYGGDVACQVLTSVNRLCVFYLQWAGHTISLKEFITPKDAAKKRRNDLKKLIQKTKSEVSKRLGVSEDDLEEHVESVHKSENLKEMSVIDASYTSTLGPTTSTIIKENEDSLYRNNLQNNMRMMIDTGAKGSRVNMNQMASLFGSVAIDGKRMPISVTGKSLPFFKPYECDPRAGGYIPTRFVTGMDPRSYYFLCIVGRDSLQHTAVKTANSGYTQRCLIKHLEGISVKYDNTVRNSDGVVLQFEYGEDGLDVTKIPFLQSIDTIDSILEAPEKMNLEVVPEVEKHKKLIKKYKTEGSDKTKRIGGFLKFCSKMAESSEGKELAQNSSERVKLISSYRNLSNDEREKLSSSDASQVTLKTGRTVEAQILTSLWYRKSPEEKAKFSKVEKLKKISIPVSSKFFGSSDCQYGAVSEALDDLIDQYYDLKYSQRRPQEQTLTKSEIRKSLYMRALKSKVDPGEAVGALCAQAIGEPLTQMTLNTFHFAGRDELNVTLGVPRMIEILRIASSKIATPIMEVPFNIGISKSTAEKLKKKFTPVPLKMMISEATVTSSLEREPKLCKRAIIRFTLHPYSVYRKVFFVRPNEVLAHIENVYLKKYLIKYIEAAYKQLSSYGLSKLSKKEANDEDNPTEERITRGLEDDDSADEDDGSQEQANDAGVSDANKQGTTRERDYSDEEDDVEDEDDSDDETRDLRNQTKQLNIKKELDIDGLFEPPQMEPIVENNEDEVEEKFDPNKIIKKEPTDEKNTSKIVKSKTKKSSLPPNAYLSRKNNVIRKHNWIKNYEFDDESSLWCEVTLELPVAEGKYDLASILRETAAISFVHRIGTIKKAFVVENDGRLMLRTEGVNMENLICDIDALSVLDFKSLYTNNIHLMVERFGIESGQRCIIKEIREVQKAYDIKVDFRHLTLLSDYFTCEGVYKACSRFALDTCASPIQKMSFETCFAFMKKSLLQGSLDYMKSPSASVIVGQPVKLGTNCMELLQKVS